MFVHSNFDPCPLIFCPPPACTQIVYCPLSTGFIPKLVSNLKVYYLYLLCIGVKSNNCDKTRAIHVHVHSSKKETPHLFICKFWNNQMEYRQAIYFIFIPTEFFKPLQLVVMIWKKLLPTFFLSPSCTSEEFLLFLWGGRRVYIVLCEKSWISPCVYMYFYLVEKAQESALDLVVIFLYNPWISFCKGPIT